MISLWYSSLHSLWSLCFAWAVYVLHYVFQNRNREAQMDGFIGECCREYFLWNTEMTSPFRLDTNTRYFVRYTLYLLTEDCRKAWKFKYQNLAFSFLNYVIILLFPPIYIYMVIEHSFMSYSYTANIYIYMLPLHYIIFCGCNLTVHHACINKYAVKPKPK